MPILVKDAMFEVVSVEGFGALSGSSAVFGLFKQPSSVDLSLSAMLGL